jgi:hypothetical protein
VTQVLTVRDVLFAALSGHALSAMTTRNSAPLASYIDLLLDAVCAVDKQGPSFCQCGLRAHFRLQP